MIFKLKVEMGNAGAKDADDIAALLAEALPRVAAKVGEDGEFGLIRDNDGNRIGRWDFSDNDPGEFVVGDDDNTGGSYGCSEGFFDEDGDQKWVCSRDRHATGLHAAGNGRKIVAVWQEA